MLADNRGEMGFFWKLAGRGELHPKSGIFNPGVALRPLQLSCRGNGLILAYKSLARNLLNSNKHASLIGTNYANDIVSRQVLCQL